MIVSHKHQFVFLKTRKTAGTSLEIGLSEYCGPDDIITRISADDEEVRAGLGFRGPQNFEIKRRFRPSLLLRNHTPAREVRRAVGRKAWDGYFKFTIERNPFDKAVSRYWWGLRKLNHTPTISEFLHSCTPHLLSGWDIYSINGKPAVDFVVRLESLDSDLNKLSEHLGFGPITMVRAKGSFRQDKRHYREVLNADDRRLIERVCAREIEHFGYEW